MRERERLSTIQASRGQTRRGCRRRGWGKGTIILLWWNKVQKQQNKTVERTRLVTILEPCEVTLYLCARLPQPWVVWAEVLFGQEFSWPACLPVYRKNGWYCGSNETPGKRYGPLTFYRPFNPPPAVDSKFLKKRGDAKSGGEGKQAMVAITLWLPLPLITTVDDDCLVADFKRRLIIEVVGKVQDRTRISFVEWSFVMFRFVEGL